MSYVRALRCRECGREFPLDPIHVCDFCFGPVEAVYDYEEMAKGLTKESIAAGPLSMWRYRDLLPVGEGEVVDINGGFTPLLKADNLGRELGLRRLYIKNDCVNPSYSYKDRVVSVAATKAREFGFEVLACASTGNLAGAVAAHAAKASMKAYVFVPADVEMGKLVGAAIYAPTLVAVNGSYDEVNRLCVELVDRYPWAFVNINLRPYYAEGSKTLAFEVAEQLGWRAPAHAVVPAASGSMFTKIWKGFNEFHRLGFIDDPLTTRMHLVQPKGSSPIVTAYDEGTLNVRPVRTKTIAKSLAIGNPADGYYALRTIRDSSGTATAVSDDELVEGIKLLARTEGVFAETAGGVTIAGLKRLAKSGVIGPDDLTVAYITGNGLKTQEAVIDSLDARLAIEPTIASFEDALRERKVRVDT